MYIEAPNTKDIRLALELLARAVDSAGTLSTLTVQVQLVGAEEELKSAKDHRQAKAKLLQMSLPSEE